MRFAPLVGCHTAHSFCFHINQATSVTVAPPPWSHCVGVLPHLRCSTSLYIMKEQSEWFLSDYFKLAVSLVVFAGKKEYIFKEKKDYLYTTTTFTTIYNIYTLIG